MIKKISFLPEFIPLIKTGKKIITRRIFDKDPGIYYFTAGRNGKKKGYIEVVDCQKVKLKISFLIDDRYSNEEKYDCITEAEVFKEGFNTLNDFIKTWNTLVPKEYRWPKFIGEEDPEIYRIVFGYLGETI